MKDSDMSGMTVNERLFALGILDEFDAAAARGDRDGVVALLQRAEVDRVSIERIVRGVVVESAPSTRPRAARA